MNMKEIGVNTRNWTDQAKDRDYWRALMNAELNFRDGHSNVWKNTSLLQRIMYF